MKTSSVATGLLSLVLALGGVACDPVVAGSGADPSTGTGAGAGSDGGAGGGQASAGPVVKDVVFNGSGCRDAGSASVTVAPEGGALTVTYAGMTLASAPGATFRHINCAVGITLEGTAGRRLAVTGATKQGVAHLPAGASGHLMSSLFFAGDPRSFDGHSTLSGPYDEPYVLTDAVTPGSGVASTCGEGAIVNLNTSLDLSALSSASMAIASLKVAFTWEPC